MSSTRPYQVSTPRPLEAGETLSLFIVPANTSDLDLMSFFFSEATKEFWDKYSRKHTKNIRPGGWKAIQIPGYHETDGMPKAAFDELMAWEEAQTHPGALQLVATRNLNLVEAKGLFVHMTGAPRRQVSSMRLGGREFRVGEPLGPGGLDALIKALPGPITMAEVDKASRASVRVSVQGWDDLHTEPDAVVGAAARQLERVIEGKWLAIDRKKQTIACPVQYVALTAEYFSEFDRFHRFEDIPVKCFESALTADTVFVSHPWAAITHPDPDGEQFELVKSLVEREEDVLIWYDYSCIPQDHADSSVRALFIDSLTHLNSLIFTSRFACITAGDYISRAWCFYEWITSFLISRGRRWHVHQRGAPNSEEHYYPFVEKLVVEGVVPDLSVGQKRDIAHIRSLLHTGVATFKMVAVGNTLQVLNEFGFNFYVQGAARYSELVDFEVLWRNWQILAVGSAHTGIRLNHLVDPARLHDTLRDRRERNHVHSHIYDSLDELSTLRLDYRILGKVSAKHLLDLVIEVKQSGLYSESYTPLAVIWLVYTFALERRGL